MTSNALVIALDLEGTLISHASTMIPRPSQSADNTRWLRECLRVPKKGGLWEMPVIGSAVLVE